MADVPATDAEAPPPTPRWVKAFLVIGAVLLFLVLVLVLVGGHGPGDHVPGTLMGGAWFVVRRSPCSLACNASEFGPMPAR